MEWVDSAACKGDPNTERWFENSVHHQNLLDLQDICALCPVRNGCGNAAMEEESKAGATGRWGFRAYMTPMQRETIARNGGLRGRDPMKVVLGMEKTIKLGKGRLQHTKVPPVPEEGVEWKRTHTALARKLLRTYTKGGTNLPGIPKMCSTLGCGEDRLRTVLDAMLQRGTIIEHDDQLVLTTNQSTEDSQ